MREKKEVEKFRRWEGEKKDAKRIGQRAVGMG
jgi:hypothetical protein